MHAQQVLRLGAPLPPHAAAAAALAAPRDGARVGGLKARLGARNLRLAARQGALQQRAANRLVQRRQLLTRALATALAGCTDVV